MTRLFPIFLALAACATSTVESQTPAPFRGPVAAAHLPHRTADGARAAAVFEALQAALPQQEAYDLDSLSCVFVQYPGHQSTHCTSGSKEIADGEKAERLGEAIRNAGALWDMGNKMPCVRTKTLHSTRESFTFDDEANAKQVSPPNVRLTGKAAEDVMAAVTGAGVKEDDGTLFIVCHRFESGKDPTCGYILRGATGPKLDRAQTLALWNAFVHDGATTVLNASNFVFDGQTLAFNATLDAVQPPPPPPVWP